MRRNVLQLKTFPFERISLYSMNFKSWKHYSSGNRPINSETQKILTAPDVFLRTCQLRLENILDDGGTFREHQSTGI